MEKENPRLSYPPFAIASRGKASDRCGDFSSFLIKNLLEPGLLGRLEGYRLVRRRPVPGGYAGSRRSPRKGGAVEFSDYREYTAGDDPRRVDWKAYARLGRLYVKEFMDERQDSVLFIFDTSASMDWGDGEEHKGRYAMRLAAGLAVCALAGGDRLAVVAGSGRNTPDSAITGVSSREIGFLPPQQGRNSLPRLWKWLGEAAFGGRTDLAGRLKDGLAVAPGTSSLYVLSDLLDPEGVEAVLRMAAGRGMEATLLHILAPGELDPPFEGERTMVDLETGERLEVSLTPGALLDYKRRLEEFFRQLDSGCRRWGARRLLINSGRPVEETLLRSLPRQNVLKTPAN